VTAENDGLPAKSVTAAISDVVGILDEVS